MVRSPALGLPLLVLILLSTIGCGGRSAQDIEVEIRRDLPVGSTTADIFTYLDDNSIEHNGQIFPARGFSVLQEANVDPETRVIEGFLPNIGYEGLLVVRQLYVYFTLDDDDRLANIIFWETGE
jgi:hypothetical protein